MGEERAALGVLFKEMMEVTNRVLKTQRSCQGRWKTGLSEEVENAENVTMAMKGVLQTRD